MYDVSDPQNPYGFQPVLRQVGLDFGLHRSGDVNFFDIILAKR